MKPLNFLCLLALIGYFALPTNVVGQKQTFDEKLYNSIQWRGIGPFRGGRSAAVTGVPGKPLLYYMGATGGGVWRTQDGGQSWSNISDGYFGGSIGAVAVAESDPNVIYVGGGEVTVRGNVSFGYGMWKSEDAGKTWREIPGFEDARHIVKIRIHPKNPDIVYAAVLGDLYQSNDNRGVFKSTDGGATWKKTLFANADAGATDLTFDPNNPRILYASTWRIRRTPYSLSSGGEGSGLWKSTDSGETWEDISANKGLPEGVFGISGVTVSPVNSERVWAIIENEKGGVFRSDDAGETWKKVNESRALRQRAWYYSRIYADTKDENIVYVVNVSYHKSTDGGVTFKGANAPHGDHHDMWIAPEDNQRMVMADDGGAQVSFDGGQNWTTYHNQPTAQFYRVTTDNHFPYRIYGAQQDNSTVRILHRTDGGNITEKDWEPSAGGESAHLAIDPNDNDVVFGGSYGGFLTRVNHRTKQTQAINVWPDNPMGYGAEGMKYRFQWNFPIFFSPHDDQKLYTTSDRFHVSRDGGRSWETISPDLTTNDPKKQKSSGGPITQDNTGVEYYCTVFAACESPYEKDLLWAGSDDGLVHVSKDGGQNWENVTPKNMPEFMMINSVEPDPFVKGGLYIAGTRYKMGDYQPYLYKTKDYGKSWTKITTGIEEEHFTRVLRADPARKGLLYAGTETGMYVSFDDGMSWHSFQLNLPIVPITDLAIKNHNLIAATQGRSFWLIDDLTPLHQLSSEIADSDAYLFQPIDSYRMGGSRRRDESKVAGQNHPGGVNVHFYLKDKPAEEEEVILSFHHDNDLLIRQFSSKAEDKKDKLNVKTNGNVFNWDMRYPDALDFDGMIMWAGTLTGPMVPPGEYKVKLTVGGETQQQTVTILKDPRSETTQEEFQQQFEFCKSICDKVSEAHQAIIDIRDIRSQLSAFTDRVKDDPQYADLVAEADAIDKSITEIEEALYQTKNQSRQDPLNFPIKLTNKLAHLNSLTTRGNFPPTEQAKEVQVEMESKINEQLDDFKVIKDNKLPAFNKLVKDMQVDVVQLKKAMKP